MPYLIFCVALFGFTLFELTTLFRSLPILQSLPYCIMLLIGVQCVVVGVLSFFGIGFSGYLNAVIELCLCAGCVVYKKMHARRTATDGDTHREAPTDRRALIIDRIGSRGDIAATAFNLLFVVIFSLIHFTPDLALAFLSDDSASHYASVVKYANGMPVTGQFSFGISGAAMLDAIRSLIDPAHYYQCYVFTEIFWWWLSTQMFYALIRRTAKSLHTALIILLCILYAFGYPLYSLNLGFGYYGASIATTCAIFFTIACLPLDRPINLCALSVLLTELGVGYLLFVPPIFLVAFIAVMLADSTWRERIPERIGTGVLVLIIPCFLTLFLNYGGYFFSGDTTTISQSISSFSDGIARDANTLKVLYADFIFIAPLAIYGFAAKIAKRGSYLRVGLFSSVFTLYCAALFIFCVLRAVSPYYYYKTYAILWMVFFVCAAIGIEQLLLGSKKLVVSYGCIWLAIIALAVTGLDAKLSEKRPNLDSVPISEQIFVLYTFNCDMSRSLIFDPETLVQIRAHEDESLTEDQIAILSGQNEKRWIQAVGFDGQCIPWQTNHNEAKYDTETILGSMDGFGYVYIDDSFHARPYPDEDYSALDEVTQYVIDNSDVAFETDFGTMYHLHENA